MKMRGIGGATKKKLEASGFNFDRFRNNLSALRTKAGVTANDMSKEIDLKAVKRIHDLEYGRGTPSLEEIIKISKYFNCSIDDILFKRITIEIIFKDEK